MDELSRMIIPAHAEVAPVTQMISRLLIPLVVTVSNLTPNSTGDVDVELEILDGTHIFCAADPDYNEIPNALRQAKEQGTVLTVTESESHEIIDVMPSPHPNRPAACAAPRPNP